MKAKTINIRVSQETADRCERLRLAGAHSGYMNSAFARIIFNIGLEKYEKVLLPLEAGEKHQPKREPRLQAAGCEVSPEAIQRTETKIIPFPGVSLPEQEVTYQNALDGFLREIGYIEE
jgi:hypothetical protein